VLIDEGLKNGEELLFLAGKLAQLQMRPDTVDGDTWSRRVPGHWTAVPIYGTQKYSAKMGHNREPNPKGTEEAS